jgi:glutamate-1-semialdehyde 2,1-aminomutase
VNADEDHEQRLSSVIPGGAHTYSRGRDQFPPSAPPILERGSGAYVWDAQGRRFLDYGMGLRSVTLGYGREEVVHRVEQVLRDGINLTLPTRLELEAAERFVAAVCTGEMVKFARHGSTVTSAAVKLARGATGRQAIAVTRQHPFHSFDDWFIGASAIPRGTSEPGRAATVKFDYGDITSLERILRDTAGGVAAVMLEPMTTQSPCPHDCAQWGTLAPDCTTCPQRAANFLQQVRRLCDAYGSIMILDEIITGFRWRVGGAQELFGVRADLSTYGKAMGNGFAIAALNGRRDLMELGGITPEGQERLFLISSTHGSEAVGLAALLGVLDVYETEDVPVHLWSYGAQFQDLWYSIAQRHGVQDHVPLRGAAVGTSAAFLDASHQPSGVFAALFSEELVRNGVLMPWISFSTAHGDEELETTGRALDKAFAAYAKGLSHGPEAVYSGPPLKPVFRTFN